MLSFEVFIQFCSISRGPVVLLSILSQNAEGSGSLLDTCVTLKQWHSPIKQSPSSYFLTFIDISIVNSTPSASLKSQLKLDYLDQPRKYMATRVGQGQGILGERLTF